MTVAETTETRLDALAHAREVLDRAVSEHRAWRGGPVPQVVNAIAALRHDLAAWDQVTSEASKDRALAEIGKSRRHLLEMVERKMCPEAAQFVAEGRDWWEE